MAERKKRLGLAGIIILAANILAVIALLLSYLAVHVSPARNWVLPFFGLFLPYLLGINLLFVLYWLLRFRIYFMISLFVMLLGWNHFSRVYQISGPAMLPDNTEALKITSYNVKNLSNDNVNLLDHEVRAQIIQYLDRTDPDILCLQEFKVVHPDPDSFIDSLSFLFNMPYHVYARYFNKKISGLDAMFIFSKYPLLAAQPLSKDEEHNFGLYCDFVWAVDTIRLFNIHLESIRFRHEDYNFISSLDLNFKEDEKIREGSVRIFNKLRNAFSLRAIQVEQVCREIASSPYPVILCGDFNDTPNSYTYQRLTARLTDAFILSGSGFANTYAGKLPSFRIDYILHDPGLQSWEFTRERIRLSDHYPVSCYISRGETDAGQTTEPVRNK